MMDICLQTEHCSTLVHNLKDDNEVLRKKLEAARLSASIIQGNPSTTTFYTGLPTWWVFHHIFCFLSPYVSSSSKMCFEDELFMVLVRLRSGLFMEDNANHFGISPSNVKKNIPKMVWYHVCVANFLNITI